MPNAFPILKPNQKSSKNIWVFRNTGANAVAKNQTRMAYEDKRDLYCMSYVLINHMSEMPGQVPVYWFFEYSSLHDSPTPGND